MRQTLIFTAAFACALFALSYGARAQTPRVLNPEETIESQPEAQQKPPVITAVAVTPGGDHLATAGDDHVVRLWNTRDGRLAHKLNGHADWVRDVAFAADGQVLLSAADDGRVILWNVEAGEKIGELPQHPHVIYDLALSPDDRLLATAGFEQSVRIYDWNTRELVDTFEGPDVDLRAVAFSPDGTRLAAAGRNGQVRVWNVATGEVDLDIAAVRIGRLRSLAWLPDGTKLVAAGEHRLLCVWNTATGELVKRVHCQTGKLLSMVVCDEQRIATGGSDNVVRVWNWQTETEADALVGHTGSVAALAFDASSRTIISGSFDTTVRVWRLDRNDAGQETADNQFDLRVR